MAFIKVLYGSSDSLVYRLMHLNYKVDIQFCDQRTYEDAVKFGFDKKAWEKKNEGMKVLIKDISPAALGKKEVK